MNLERCGLRVEIRVVLHRQTFDRLPQLAQFLARNLPFVEHVALMGLEMMGYVRMNLDALWIDPAEYQCQLAEAVHILDQHHLNVSIYNHQLCVLDRALWPFARKSISDWKNEYLNECRELRRARPVRRLLFLCPSQAKRSYSTAVAARVWLLGRRRAVSVRHRLNKGPLPCGSRWGLPRCLGRWVSLCL